MPEGHAEKYESQITHLSVSSLGGFLLPLEELVVVGRKGELASVISGEEEQVVGVGGLGSGEQGGETDSGDRGGRQTGMEVGVVGRVDLEIGEGESAIRESAEGVDDRGVELQSRVEIQPVEDHAGDEGTVLVERGLRSIRDAITIPLIRRHAAVEEERPVDLSDALLGGGDEHPENVSGGGVEVKLICIGEEQTLPVLQAVGFLGEQPRS